MTTPADIGHALIRTRRSVGLTQRELADRLGVKQPQVARWERAAYRTASLQNVDAVARALGVDLLPLAAEDPGAYTVTCEPDTGDAILTRLGVERGSLAAFCRSHRIAELGLFGSVLRHDFRPSSDVDVLVTYGDREPPGFDELTDMASELEALFGRKVDLVDRRLVERSENYLRRRRILGSVRSVYVA